ncbi:hypothetical protein Tco_0591779 [Tanacetum coccineum]
MHPWHPMPIDLLKTLLKNVNKIVGEFIGLAVPVFNQGDDLITCLNKEMAFLIAIDSLRQGQSYVGTGYMGNATSSGGNNAGEQTRIVKCYNCQGEDEEQLAFLTDPDIPDGQATQTTIPNTVAFQTEDLDAYASDCDDVSNAKAVLMAYLSNYDNEITSDSNIISYSQYWQGTQQAAVQDNDLYAQQDSMILSVIEQITREKMIDSQMDDMIKEKLALTQQIDSLEQNLSNQIKEKESLLQTFTVFKNESKEKESKYMDKEIDLEKKIKELDNIVYKVGQSAQTKAQRIKPTLYDGSVISSQHATSHVIDDEETLILEELNRLFEDFGKRFVLQQELTDEQAFWLQTSRIIIDYLLVLQIELLRILLKIIPDAITEGEWGFEHTKAVFLKEIIPFLKTLKDIFNVFDKDLLNDVTEVQTVFNQMEAVVQQCSLDKQYFEIVKKELFLKNDRLLQQIMSQDVLLAVMNSTTLNGESVNLEYFENNDLKAQLQAKDTTIYQKTMETIHVTFDELTTMASDQFSLGPGLQSMTHATSSSGELMLLVKKLVLVS